MPEPNQTVDVHRLLEQRNAHNTARILRLEILKAIVLMPLVIGKVAVRRGYWDMSPLRADFAGLSAPLSARDTGRREECRQQYSGSMLKNSTADANHKCGSASPLSLLRTRESCQFCRR